MDKANAAEWLLRRVVDPVRASELVGDQLEAHPAAGRLRFWISIAQMFLMFSWRTIIGVAASPVVGLILALAFFSFANSQTRVTVGLSETTVFHLKVYLLGVSVLLWAATVFSLVRLGWRSTLTGVGLIASLLWSTSLSFFWQWTPAIVLTILWVGFILFCVSSAKRRRALGILCGAVVAAWLTAFALSIFPRDPYSVFGKWQFLGALFLVPIVESRTTMFLHRKFIASQDTGL
jgi:uncharacterized membrane protein